MTNPHQHRKAIKRYRSIFEFNNLLLLGIALFLQSCSSNKESNKKEDLSKWVGNYFYGSDLKNQGIILTIDSIGNSIRGTLSDGTDPKLSIDDDGKVWLGEWVAALRNDSIRFTSIHSGDTTNYKLPRMSNTDVASMKGYNERIKNEIKSVKIGSQEWMAADLKTQTYSNRDPIREAESPEEWKRCNDEKVGCWCYFNNDKNQNVLYNWYAATDPRGLAPKGWRVPSLDDFLTLANFLGGEGKAGIQMKNEGFHPPRDNDGSLNFSRFNAVGTGYRDQGWRSGEFRGKTTNGVAGLVFYWTTTFNVDLTQNIRPSTVGLFINSRRLDRSPIGANIASGLTVRCIKNTDTESNEAVKVSAKLVYADGSLSESDILNDKSVVLWNVNMAEGDKKASNKTMVSFNGHVTEVEIKIMNNDEIVDSEKISINGIYNVEVKGTGCGKLTITVLDHGRTIYSGGIEFGCGE
jgi:uncharacterized protein (TIGR02145 family)